MRNIILGLVLMMVGLSIMGCDGFSRKIEVDYSDFEPKGVIIGVLATADTRDSLFRERYDYSSQLQGPHRNRIFISNSSAPGGWGGGYYKAHVHLESEDGELPLTYVDMDGEQINYPAYFGVDEDLIPGKVYEVFAEFDPDSAPIYVQEWAPVSARDTMPPLTEFTIGEVHLDYEEGNYWATPRSGYFDIQLEDEADRNNMYLIDVTAIFVPDTLYPDYVNLIVQGNIDRPDKTTNLDLFGVSKNNLFHEDEFTQDGKKRIHFRFGTSYGSHDRDQGATLVVRVSNLSNQYIQFQRSSQQYESNVDNPFAEPVEIYTNVNNGYGVLALAARSFQVVEVR